MPSGAKGYVRRRAAPEELIRAIRAIAAGRIYIDPVISGEALGGVRAGSSARRLGAGPTARENEVLQLIAEGYSN